MCKEKTPSLSPQDSTFGGGKEILCPFCHHTALTASSDAKGHIGIVCENCGQFFILDLAEI
jgi:transcription elongation factor Elf1